MLGNTSLCFSNPWKFFASFSHGFGISPQTVFQALETSGRGQRRPQMRFTDARLPNERAGACPSGPGDRPL